MDDNKDDRKKLINEETLAAIEEAENNPQSLKSFDNVDELFESWNEMLDTE